MKYRLLILFLFIPALCYGGTIFSDDFESGDLSNWDAIYEQSALIDISTTSAVVNNGSFAMVYIDTDTSGDRGWVDKTGVYFDEGYIRFYIYLSSVTLYQECTGMRYVMKARLDGGGKELRLGYDKNGKGYIYETVTNTGLTSDDRFNADAWNCYEIHCPTTTAGVDVEWWINGVKQPSIENKDFSAYTGYNDHIYLGSYDGSTENLDTATYYFDDFIVSDEYNGEITPEPEEGDTPKSSAITFTWE